MRRSQSDSATLFLKNNQPGNYTDQADERYLNPPQYQLPPEEPLELHDKDILPEESLKRNLKRAAGFTLGPVFLILAPVVCRVINNEREAL